MLKNKEMKEYVLLFRMDITSAEKKTTDAQMQVYMQQWMAWINDIELKGQLADGGNHFSSNGKVLRPGGIMEDGPYTVNKESVAGYIIILAKDMDNALAIAQKCPILEGEGTSVEIRETDVPGK